MEEDVDLVIIVDGEEIDVNLFVQNVIGKAVAGAVSALKGVKADWKEIDLIVKRAT